MQKSKIKQYLTMTGLIVFLNILAIIFMLKFIPFCPEKWIGHVGETIYCRSFLWNSVTFCIIQFIFMFISYFVSWKYSVNRIYGNMFSAIPLIFLIYLFYSITIEALDRIAPGSGDKIEVLNIFDIYLSFIFTILLFISLVIFWNKKIKKLRK